MIFNRTTFLGTAVLASLAFAQGVSAQENNEVQPNAGGVAEALELPEDAAEAGAEEALDDGAEDVDEARPDAGEVAEDLTTGEVLGETGVPVAEENVLPSMPFGDLEAMDSIILQADEQQIAEWFQDELLISEQLQLRARCAVVLNNPERYGVEFQVAGSDEMLAPDMLQPFCASIVTMEPDPVGEEVDEETAEEAEGAVQ